MKRLSLSARLIGAAFLWILVALSVGGLALSYAFRQSAEAAFDKKLEAILHALIAAAEMTDEGKLSPIRSIGEPRFEKVFSGWYWQISDSKNPLVRSRSLWDQTLQFPGYDKSSGQLTRGNETGPRGRQLRLAEQTLTIPRHERLIHFKVAADAAEIKEDIRDFNTLLMLSLGLLGLGLIGALMLQVGYGLQPLRRVAGDLERIRSGKAVRLTSDYPAEIQPLVKAINAVLDYDQELVQRARTHAGNLAHGLKTPLSILKAGAEGLDPKRAALHNEQIVTMTRLIDHHLSRASTAGTPVLIGVRAPVIDTVNEIRSGLQRVFADRNFEIRVDIPSNLVFQGERHDLEEMLGNLMENACKWAVNAIAVTARSEGDWLLLSIEDDGPGFPQEDADIVIEWGKRLDERKPGSGLGLAIVTDIVDLYGGELILQRSRMGGLEAALRLPASILAATKAT